jgi:hypothetical protein
VVERRITGVSNEIDHPLVQLLACGHLHISNCVLFPDFHFLTSSNGFGRKKEGNKEVGGTKEEPN